MISTDKSILIIGAVLFVISAWFFIRPGSGIHMLSAVVSGKKQNIISFAVIFLTVAVCTLPMGLSPYYNGEIPVQRDQYEETARAFLDGRLYIDNDDIDEALLSMENPYDPDARDELGVYYEWDHALYNGHYYMYFGVVPVLLLFLPFRAITGSDLTTYHATQIFAALFIIGLFLLMRKIARRFFDEMPLSVFLFLFASFSMMSLWYIVSAPALYCTAIVSAICFAVWSIFFYIKAVYDDIPFNKSVGYGVLGSLCGALVFGCRPSVALFFIIVFPVLLLFIKKYKKEKKLLPGILLAAFPYFVIGALLMLYNYARFENPFEFGQTYQLTVADQRELGNAPFGMRLESFWKGLKEFFFGFDTLNIEYGVFVTFPILAVSVFGFAFGTVRERVRRNGQTLLVVFLFLAVLAIIAADSVWSPYIVFRYFSDIYWLMGIITFIVLGYIYSGVGDKKTLNTVLCLFALAVAAVSVILFWIPNDCNYADYLSMQLS